MPRDSISHQIRKIIYILIDISCYTVNAAEWSSCSRCALHAFVQLFFGGLVRVSYIGLECQEDLKSKWQTSLRQKPYVFTVLCRLEQKQECSIRNPVCIVLAVCQKNLGLKYFQPKIDFNQFLVGRHR